MGHDQRGEQRASYQCRQLLRCMAWDQPAFLDSSLASLASDRQYILQPFDLRDWWKWQISSKISQSSSRRVAIYGPVHASMRQHVLMYLLGRQFELGEALQARTDALGTFRELGPPDLVHIIKSGRAGTKDVSPSLACAW